MSKSIIQFFIYIIYIVLKYAHHDANEPLVCRLLCKRQRCSGWSAVAARLCGALSQMSHVSIPNKCWPITEGEAVKAEHLYCAASASTEYVYRMYINTTSHSCISFTGGGKSSVLPAHSHMHARCLFVIRTMIHHTHMRTRSRRPVHIINKVGNSSLSPHSAALLTLRPVSRTYTAQSLCIFRISVVYACDRHRAY